jgi:hypothetical protein
MRGLAWMAVLSAGFILAALTSSIFAAVSHDWLVMAHSGVYGLIAIAFAMLALRE